jgi:two-component system NtrC family sensor kinase
MTDSGIMEHAGFAVLEDVSSQLVRGLGAEDLLTGVAAALCRGLKSDGCRIWVRTPDGASFRAMVPEGHPQPRPELADRVREWVEGTERQERSDGGWHLRVPLVYEGARLGVLETFLPDTPDAEIFRKVIAIVANMLSPLLASFELSEDLASEVALRTRETEAQRRFTSKIIDSLPVGLYVIDRDYNIQAWNARRETGRQGVGRETALGRPVFEVLHRQPRDLLKREFDSVFNTGRIEQVEVQSSASGEARHYRITKVPMRLDDDEISHVITIGEDLTDWKTVQRQAAQTEKLAAVGQLAAGVMHELNNPLATIGACVEALTLRSGDLTEPVRSSIDEYLHIVDSELSRCKAIVDGLLDFSRPKSRSMKPVQINQVVEDALFLVKHHDRFKRIQVVRQMGAHLPEIHGNAEQLIQVFLALMLNSIDAMEGTGTLTVTTEMSMEREGEMVIEFADTGMGIPSDDIPKIFEPFFTTKQPGRGTGLGLSICYGVVHQHGGGIQVDSGVGRGSKFRVYLPLKPPTDLE